MDEVTYLVQLLKQNWASASLAAGLPNHQVTPTIIDIRNRPKILRLGGLETSVIK